MGVVYVLGTERVIDYSPLPQGKIIPVSQKPRKLWLNVAVFSTVLFVVLNLYTFFQEGSYGLHAVSDSLADTAVVLIGLSMALSSICYFWDFADTKIIYRKDLGLCGFAFALAHGTMALFFLEEFSFPTYYLSQSAIMPFTFGLLSLLIYTGMAVIANRHAIHVLGGELWRLLLRVGYLAYFYSILHFSLIMYPDWITWGEKHETFFPPPSFLLFLFAVSILLLRVALFIAQVSKKNSIFLDKGEKT